MSKPSFALFLAVTVLAGFAAAQGFGEASVNPSSTGNPATNAWTKSLSEYVADDQRVPINSVSPPPPPGGSVGGDYSAFLLPTNLTQTPVVTVTSTGNVSALPHSTISQVGQAYSLVVADAIARGAVDTAADLFYQAMLRTDTVETTAVVINSMVEVAGCEPPLTSALEVSYDTAVKANASVIFTLALHNVQANIAELASCLATVTSAVDDEVIVPSIAPAAGPEQP